MRKKFKGSHGVKRVSEGFSASGEPMTLDRVRGREDFLPKRLALALNLHIGFTSAECSQPASQGQVLKHALASCRLTTPGEARRVWLTPQCPESFVILAHLFK